MAIQLSSTLMLPAGLAVAVAAFLLADRAPAAGTPAVTVMPAQTAAAVDDRMPDLPEGTAQQLPPNHPPIGSAKSPHGSQGRGPVAGEEPAAITWHAPAEWKVRENTNTMRLATYGVGDSAELTVSRAGGSLEANINRWAGQFDGSSHTERKDRTVHGMKVTVVHMAGTFVGGGGMTPGAASEPNAGWVMLAAIVESNGNPYFFKLLGPADQVERARTTFEHMLDGIVARPG